MIFRFYKVAQHLSIDIVLGAVILLHFFSRFLNAEISWITYCLLAGSIWIIYTVDHLRDAKTAVRTTRERYIFHAKYRRFLRLLIGIVLLLSGVMVFFLPIEIIIAGSVVAMFSVGYIFFHSFLARNGMKELYIALIYTSGIMVAPVAITRHFDVFAFVMLFVLSLLNLTLFSWFETAEDEADSFDSIATRMGKDRLKKLNLVITSIGLALALVGLEYAFSFSLFFSVGFALLFLLQCYTNWARKKDRYRTIGDGVFFLAFLF